MTTQPPARQVFPPQRGEGGPVDRSSGPPAIGPAGSGPAVARLAPRSTLFGLTAGQVVVAQVGLLAAVAGARGGPVWLVVTTPVALLLLILAVGRFRRRWLYQWIGQGARYFGRRRSLPAGSASDAVLDLLRPTAAVTSIEVGGDQVGVVEDAYGLTAILEVGSTSGLLVEAQPPVPALGGLLPARSADQPNVRLQLLLSGVAAPTGSVASPAVATSYRQLTEGRILAKQRVLLAVHVRRSDGFIDEDLRRSLTSAVRRVRRRLDRSQLPCRALAGDSVHQAIADLAHHDGTGLHESWSALEAGGMRQICFQLTRWPDPRAELSRVLLPRLLALPGGSATVALSVERAAGDQDLVNADLVIRIAAPSPASLTAAVNGLRTLLGAAGATGRPLDGEQLDALAATLPLGGGASGRSAVLSGVVTRGGGLGQDGSGIPVSPAALSALEVPVGGAGLVLGINRHGNPVTVRLFRPEPTRTALIGGLRCAELVALRALAVGAQVIVQSGRPYAWEPFLRGISAGGTSVVAMVPPGRLVEPPAPTPMQPQLVIVDVGPVGTTGIPVVESAWRSTLLVRDELGQTDLDVLARADIALLQPLNPNEAYVASAALGLGDSAGWLTRIRADMVGVVVGRRTLRWALLSTTPLEQQLIGAPTR